MIPQMNVNWIYSDLCLILNTLRNCQCRMRKWSFIHAHVIYEVFCLSSFLLSARTEMTSPGGGVLTLTWYTYMCLPFGALFREIWYSDRGFSSEIKEPKLHKLGVFGANYCKKHPIWSNWVLFFRKWYTDGWEIRQKIGIEIVRFSRSGRHIHVRFWWK